MKASPSEVRNDRENGRMVIVWDDGARLEYAYDDLHNACPSATCRGHGGELEPPQLRGVQLLHIQEVGTYALRFRWSEGGCHDGIYTWDYLRELGRPTVV